VGYILDDREYFEEITVTYLKILFWNSRKGTKEDKGNVSNAHDRFPGRESNRESYGIPGPSTRMALHLIYIRRTNGHKNTKFATL
jgi:hypothetical protein